MDHHLQRHKIDKKKLMHAIKVISYNMLCVNQGIDS
jgi:hypothetical protein